MKINLKKKVINIKSLFTSLLLIGILLGPLAFKASADNLFAGGNFVTAVNNTQRNADWSDPVSADPGNVIEFRITVQNTQSGTVAHDVTFHVNFPTSPSNSPQVQGIVSANGVSVSDTATVNVNGTAGYLLIYENGHTRVFSPRCPGDGCTGDDSFRDGGNINVGDLAFGESAQVSFKAALTNPGPVATPTPTPSPTPSPTPRPTATPTPTTPPAQSQTQAQTQAQAQTQTQTVNNTVTNNNSSSSNSSANVNVTQSAPPAVVLGTTSNVGVGYSYVSATTLPKTGLPALAWLGSGFVPLGYAVKRFGKKFESKITESASYIFEKRSIDKDA